jgi:hypothetical protein
MRAYKFLDAEGRAPFTLTPWTVGEWVETADAVPCREGVHACRAADLAYWLAPTLWEVELDGDVTETRHKVTARRGRLVGAVTEYPSAVVELGVASAWRARDRAVAALRADGDDRLADELAAVDTVEALAALADRVDDASPARTAAALAVDTAVFAISGPLTEAPFIAAFAAGHERATVDDTQAAFDAGYDAERAFQSQWLAERLGLPTS